MSCSIEESPAVASARAIDLNADLGEGFPNDRALLELVTSASISCGAHAGSVETIRETLSDARETGVRVGAHPGYPDREGFGRRNIEMSPGQITDLIVEQVHLLSRLATEFGLKLAYIKPHGALFNQAQREPRIAEGVLAATQDLALPVFGQPGSLLEEMARARGLRFVAEGFPDRRYREDGTLVARTEPGAILHTPEEVEAQVIRLVDDGRVETLCIHGDDPRAVANATLVRAILDRAGIGVRAFRDRS
jgi:UPF0271 protein